MKNTKSITKRVLCLILCLSIIFAMAACKPEAPVDPNSTPSATTTDSKGGIIADGTYTPSAAIVETLIETKDTQSGDLSANGNFYMDYDNFAEEQLANKELAVEIAAEGFTLLKNEGNALPFTTERKLTVFGARAANYVTSGSGSGSGTTGANGIELTTVDGALEMAGYMSNPKTMNMYRRENASAELGMEYYTPVVTSTYKNYNDAAILWLSRSSGEGGDHASSNVAGHSEPTDHNLMLDDNEKALILHIKEHFPDRKIIAVINSSNIMQIPELAEEKTDDNYGVDAIIWVGSPGNNGLEALGQILNGTVTPSGRTSDLWPTDFTKMPTWTNALDQTQHTDTNGEAMNASFYDKDGNKTPYYSIEYREDIYMGYRYYETKYADMESGAEEWYDSEVLYPFGYGLSYTDFEWKLDNVAATAEIDQPNRTVTIRVWVKNTGNLPGKDVVQVYYSAPYTVGGIEKASANLVGFAKTDLLQPGQAQIVTISFAAQEMASFDWSDANSNGFAGYELEAGDYNISIRKNSHDVVDSVTRTVKEIMLCKTDYITGNQVEPVFVDKYTTVNDSLLNHLISRSTGLEQPTVASVADRTLSAEKLQELDDGISYRSYQDQETDPWYVSSVPDSWTQAATHKEDYSDVTILLSELAGTPYMEPYIADDNTIVLGTDENSQKWETFMNQLTWEEMCDLADSGTPAVAVPSVGKASEKSGDGPVQIKGNPLGTLFPSAPIMAATWNTDLAYRMGNAVGNDCLFSGTAIWLGPGLNTHRSPLSGRNFEYYSEDGMHAALIAEQVVRGAAEKGTVMFLKHFFLNDQESHRMDGGGVATFATEQAMREIYLKPFEYVVKNGLCNGLMSSFNRIGWVSAAVNWASHKDLLREEWGFKGSMVTDAWVKDYAPADLLVRAGDEQVLGSARSYPVNALHYGLWDPSARNGQGIVLVAADNSSETAGFMAWANGDDTSSYYTVPSATHYFAVRRSAQAILYNRVNSLVNSNGFVYKDLTLNTVVNIDTSTKYQLVVPDYNDAVFTISDAELAKLPTGTTFDDVTGTLTFTPSAEHIGEYSAVVDFTCNGGRASASLTFVVKIQDKWHVNDAGIEDDTITVKAGETVSLLINNPVNSYGSGPYDPSAENVQTLSSSNIRNAKIFAYGFEAESGSAFYLKDDQTFADLIAYNIEDLINIAWPQFSLYVDVNGAWQEVREGEAINGLAFTQNVEHWAGLSRSESKKGYDINTGATLSGTAGGTGTYRIKVVYDAPLCGAKFGNALFPSNNGYGMIQFEKVITLVFE